MPRHVLVLNTTFEPINVCSLKRALILLLKDRAEVVESASHRIRSERLCLTQPTVVRLRTYVKIPPSERRRISRRAVMARDGFRCQYCGSPHHLTLDHVVPTSRGGRTTWDNLVTSCAPCNVRKGSKLPGEIGMALRARPRPPSLSELLWPGAGEIPNDWVAYLTPAPT